MGVESATEANECAHCYAFDAECIAFQPRAPPPSHRTATRQPRSDPPTASRRRVRCDHRKSPLTCGAFQGNVGDLEGRGRCEKRCVTASIASTQLSASGPLRPQADPPTAAWPANRNPVPSTLPWNLTANRRGFPGQLRGAQRPGGAKPPGATVRHCDPHSTRQPQSDLPTTAYRHRRSILAHVG